MFKYKKIMITVITLFLIFLIPNSIKAATLSNVTYNNGTITVEGKSPNTKQVQIVIFKKDKSPIYFATIDAKDGVFNSDLPAKFDFEEGEYLVKAADYGGENTSSKTLLVELINKTTTVEASGEKDDTPKTGYIDNTYIYMVITFTIITASVFLQKRKILNY